MRWASDETLATARCSIDLKPGDPSGDHDGVRVDNPKGNLPRPGRASVWIISRRRASTLGTIACARSGQHPMWDSAMPTGRRSNNICGPHQHLHPTRSGEHAGHLREVHGFVNQAIVSPLRGMLCLLRQSLPPPVQSQTRVSKARAHQRRGRQRPRSITPPHQSRAAGSPPSGAAPASSDSPPRGALRIYLSGQDRDAALVDGSTVHMGYRKVLNFGQDNYKPTITSSISSIASPINGVLLRSSKPPTARTISLPDAARRAPGALFSHRRPRLRPAAMRVPAAPLRDSAYWVNDRGGIPQRDFQSSPAKKVRHDQDWSTSQRNRGEAQAQPLSRDPR